MKRLIRPAALLLLVVAITLPAAADQSKSLYAKGQDAEARQNYEQAYDLYKQAFELKPKDTRYRAAFERLRFLASASHVHRGQLLQEAGKLDEALAEFQKAAAIDPSSFIAQQQIKATLRMIEEAKSPGAPHSENHPRSPIERRLDEAQGPVDLAPIANSPISLKMTADTKVIYETVGKLAGINVLFDPDYTSRNIKVELNNVTLDDALEIIALESKTFWRPVTANTIYVALDNPGKRKEVEQSVVKTFYLANLSQPTELQDISNALRQVLEIRQVQALQNEGALVVRGTPDQIALSQKLIDDLDRAKPEVVVDVAILQVSRDKMHTLGLSPPTSATVALQNNLSTTTTGTTTTTTGNTSTTSGTPNQVNLNRLGNLNATDFTVTISPATASALFSDSDTKLIQNPQIRALDGQKASLKIGSRVPIASGSFQPGIGGVGINPLVNTQFQYLDVGVNVDITPRVHPGGEVSLKVAMDISSVTGSSNIGGITQPIIGQRKIEQDIRLRDGEVNLLGGMMENQETKSISGIPGLANIPILKYLFAQTNTDHEETETVFVIIPHIVRELDVDELNQRALDVGTANSIELRRRSPSPALTPVSTPPAQTSPAAPAGAMPAPAQTAPSQTATSAASFGFDPANATQKTGATFAVNVLLNGAQNVYSVPLQIRYDPKVLQVVNVSNGAFLAQDGQIVALLHHEDDAAGTVQVTATRPPGTSGVSGQGSVVTLTFMAKAPGQSNLMVSSSGLHDPAMQSLPAAGAVATVTVQ